MKNTILITFSAVLMSACATNTDNIDMKEPTSSHQKLAGTSWVWETDLPRDPYIEFKANGHLGGFTGCNQISGVFSETSGIKDGRHVFELGEIITTEMACAEGMDEEGKFLDALGKLRSFKFLGKDRINLFGNDGSEIVSLDRQTD